MPEKKGMAPRADFFANRQRTEPTRLDAIDQMIDWGPADKKTKKDAQADNQRCWQAGIFSSSSIQKVGAAANV